MSLEAYKNALYVMTGDVYNLMVNGYSQTNLYPLALKNKLVKALSNLSYWQWDPFNFNRMTITDASIIESMNRVIENPVSDEEIPLPGIGYTITSNTDDKYEYEITAKYSDNDSYITDRIERKFKVTPKTTTESNNVHITKYDLFTT